VILGLSRTTLLRELLPLTDSRCRSTRRNRGRTTRDLKEGPPKTSNSCFESRSSVARNDMELTDHRRRRDVGATPRHRRIDSVRVGQRGHRDVLKLAPQPCARRRDRAPGRKARAAEVEDGPGNGKRIQSVVPQGEVHVLRRRSDA
jgi:hypothetical protein